MMLKSGLLIAFLGLCSTATASEVIFTLEKAGREGNSALAFDLVTSGDVAGFNFSIDLGSATEKSVDLSSCLGDLPKGFNGGCQVSQGKLNVIAYSETPGHHLPSGIVSVGHVLIKGLDSNATLAVSNLELSDDSGSSISVQSKISGQTGSASESK